MQLEPAELASPSVPYSYVPLQPQEPGIAEYWRILLKRKWTVIAFAVIVFTLGTVATFRMTRIYDAVARIAINRENPEPMGIKELSTTESDDWDYTVGMDTQIRILEGDTLAWQVIQGMHLDSNPKFAGGLATHAKSGGLQAPTVDTATQDALLGMFHGGLRVSAIPNTRLVEIRYSSSDPQMAADIANNLANSYVELNRRTKYEATMQASDWLSRQLADLQIKVETSQQKLIDYQKSHGIVGTDDKENIVTKKLDDLNKQLTDAQADRIQKQANYQLTLQGNPDLVPGVAQDLFLARLREQESDLKNQMAQLTTQFGPSYPKVVETNNRLKQVDAAIQTEITKQTGRIKSDYEAAVGRERMLQAALEQQKQEATKLNESAIEYSILKREADTNRQLYDGLLQKLKEAGVTAGLQASNIRVVDAARVPLAPSKPDIPRNLGIALLLGLTGGVALAFVLEVLDNTVRTPEQVEAIAALPSLGIVPLTAGAHQANLLAKKTRGLLTTKQVRPNGAVGLVAYSRPKSGIAESFRALRTSILLSSMGAPPKTIVVTSALPREGKTTTSVNSAVVLAQKGGKVLLVDADMRRPGVHQVMGLSARSGLSTVLTGSDSYANAILQSRQLNNLFVLPAGPTPPHPAELLGSAAMKKLLDEWSAVYDHIVIDTPPILSVTDPVVLSVEVDAVVLVIRSGQTSKDALRRARDLLTQVNARVMGVVVNAVDLQSPDLSYHYYYGSKYGGSYYEDGAARN